MRRFDCLSAVLTLAVLLCACSPQARREAEYQPISDDANYRQSLAMGNAELFEAFTNACAHATNGAHAQELFTAGVYEKGIVTLARQSPSELRRKLGTLDRGTSRAPYTKEQVKEALRRKGA